jgi:putative spermidine/putrescine transport system ATP-binding protein
VGSPEEVYRRPDTIFVAQFLGEANLLTVTDGRVDVFDVTLRTKKSGVAVLRPEHMAIEKGSHPGAGRRRAYVEEATYQGTRYRLVVKPEGVEKTMIASMPAPVDTGRFEIGQLVTLKCEPSAIHLIESPADGSESSDHDVSGKGA